MEEIKKICTIEYVLLDKEEHETTRFDIVAYQLSSNCGDYIS